MWKIIFVFVAFAALASGGVFDGEGFGFGFFSKRGGSFAKYKNSIEFKNYYNKSCSNGVPHIMKTCDHDFSNKRCGPKGDRQLVKMTDKMIAQTLHEHNILRAQFARGEVEGYPGKVKRMSKLRWDPELAYYAEVLALQCLWEHDHCHYSSEFPYSGQNLFMREGSVHINPSDLISLSINEWFIEKDDIPIRNRSSTLICTENLMNLPEQIGHFTAMIHEYATAIGCAIVYAKNGGDPTKPNTEYYYCNYGATNAIDQPVYRGAKRAGEECKTGQDPIYKGLCSSKEDFRDTIFVKPRTKKFPEPPTNEGAIPKVYVEVPKSQIAAAEAAKAESISYSNPNELLAGLQQQGVPKEVIDQLRQKMKLGPLKGKYTFKIQTARDKFAMITLEF